jgi:4-amino-4-deoxy-L-arabinose transferase-like glycosyltransferase
MAAAARRVLLGATALRLVVAELLPLGVDESYAVVVSRTLTLSYFDHPPAVFWLTHLATRLGGESPLAVRWPFVLLFAVACWLLYRVAGRLFGERAAFWTLVSAQLIPVFSLSGGSWALPDGPLLTASAAAALALLRALDISGLDVTDAEVRPAAEGTAAPRWRAWIALGLALGAAGLSKYHAALLGAGAAAFVASDPESRRWLRRPQPWVAVAIAALCVTPVLFWNAQHEWVSFRFQGGRASGGGRALTALGQNIAGQAGYILPWFWVPLMVVLVRALRAGPRQRATWFCVCLGVLPIVVFTAAALGGRPGLPHWPAPGFWLLLPLLGAAIARWEVRAPARALARMRTAAAVFVGLVTIVVSHAATGWVARVVPSLRRADPVFELLTYRTLTDSLTAEGLLQPARFIATADWLRGAKIGYALGAERPVLVLGDEPHHFAYAFDQTALRGTSGLLLVRRDRSEDDAALQQSVSRFASRFERLDFVRTVPVLRGADTALLVGVFRAAGLRAAATVR